ncbi:MAG: hypothetical protein CVV32_07565 [Methanomicrobiales archaeon HGW-Methanomicrobiales-3]|nr:MAG: hypothetical protein CVV32_07565 [Methanomicrobiales archaeon HGW-Methanomicrobiales-3]
MSPPSSRTTGYSVITGFVILAILVLIPMVISGPAPMPGTVPGTGAASGVDLCSPFIPIFTDPAVKLAETSRPEFVLQLFDEAVAYEPLLATNGTQVHMGFWSGKGNHGSLVVLLDAINSAPVSAAGTIHKAIWDEGVTSSYQYPSYVTMQNERWYERGYPVNGTALIMGRAYVDPYPVSPEQADIIWGQYSERYAMMAVPLSEATGNPVTVWCYVEGARANRVFYTYELPILEELEKEGVVTVRFAKEQTADWTVPGDWIYGTANAPEPIPAS